MNFSIFLIIVLLTRDEICQGLADKHEDSNNFKIRSDGISAISNVYRKLSPKENIEEVVLVPHRLRQVKFLNADFKWIPGSSRKVKADKNRVQNFELFTKREQRLSKIKKLLNREADKNADAFEKDYLIKRTNSDGEANGGFFTDDGRTNNYYRLMQEYNKLSGGEKSSQKINGKENNVKYETKLNTYNPGPKATKIIVTNYAENNDLNEEINEKNDQLKKNVENEDLKGSDFRTSLEPDALSITEGNGYRIPAYSQNAPAEQMQDIINTSEEFSNKLHGKGIPKNRKNNNKYDSVYNIAGSMRSNDNSKTDDMSIIFNPQDENYKKNKKGYRPYKFIENSSRENRVQGEKNSIPYEDKRLKQGYQIVNNVPDIYTLENGEFFKQSPTPISTRKYKNFNIQENAQNSENNIDNVAYNQKNKNVPYNRNIEKIMNLSTIKSSDAVKSDKHAYLNGAMYPDRVGDFQRHSLLKNEANQINPNDSNNGRDKTISLDNRERTNSPMPSTKVYGVTAKPNINSLYSAKEANKKQEIPTDNSAAVDNLGNSQSFHNSNYKGTGKFSMKMSTTPLSTSTFDTTRNIHLPTQSRSNMEPTSEDPCDMETPPSAFMIAEKAAVKALNYQKAQNSAAMKASMEVQQELAKKAEMASDSANESITDKQVIVDLLEEMADNIKRERESNPDKESQCNLEQEVVMARDQVDLARESLDNAKRMHDEIRKISDGIHDIKVRAELSLEAEKIQIASLRDKIDDERIEICELQRKIEELKACKKKKKHRRFRLFKWSRETDALKRHVRN